MRSLRTRQQGMTLVVSLIMLVLITLMAISSFRLGKQNMQIAGNMQSRQQGLDAAAAAIEATTSTSKFSTTPNTATTLTFSVNASGKADISVAVTPTCVSSKTIPISQLDFTKQEDAGCLVGLDQKFGVAGAGSTDSLCADQLWDIAAVSSDTVTNTKTEMHQGVALRTSSTSDCP